MLPFCLPTVCCGKQPVKVNDALFWLWSVVFHSKLFDYQGVYNTGITITKSAMEFHKFTTSPQVMQLVGPMLPASMAAFKQFPSEKIR